MFVLLLLHLLKKYIYFPISLSLEQGHCFCSQNAILHEEKERREKELRILILEEAEVYIQEFYEKRKANAESNKVNNREREKVINISTLPSFYPIFHGYMQFIVRLRAKDSVIW